MSKAAKLSIFILVVVTAVSVAFAGFAVFEKQNLEKRTAVLEQELSKAESREKQNLIKIKELTQNLQQAEEDKVSAQDNLAKAEERAADLLAQVSQLTQMREQFDQDMEQIIQERDQLLEEVQELKESPGTARHEIIPPPLSPEKEDAQEKSGGAGAEQTAERDAQLLKGKGEDYWAGILKEKAALEVNMEQLNQALSEKSVLIVELKQENENLKLDLDTLRHEKEKIEREIKYKEDTADNLSLQLAREKSEKKFIDDKLTAMDQENVDLRKEIKGLLTAKNTLETSMIRLTEEKNKIARKLEQTERMVQGKISEIWDIKDNLDRTLQNTPLKSMPQEVELPPIVVHSGSGAGNSSRAAKNGAGFNGKIVSVNEENNFVIVDLGDADGVRLGDQLSVYRGDQYIARLEVIQTRPNISAADIKDQWSKIQSGDAVK